MVTPFHLPEFERPDRQDRRHVFHCKILALIPREDLRPALLQVIANDVSLGGCQAGTNAGYFFPSRSLT